MIFALLEDLEIAFETEDSEISAEEISSVDSWTDADHPVHLEIYASLGFLFAWEMDHGDSEGLDLYAEGSEIFL